MMPYIHAVTVNHNTSHFVELMLRTLFLKQQLDPSRVSITVLDNASDDAHLPALRAYLDANNIAFQQTGLNSTVAVEKHGIALQSFIAAHPDCSYFLFLDSDIWFIEADTVSTMLGELDAVGDEVFANQARIAGYYAGRIIEGKDGIPGAAEPATFTTTFDGREYVTTQMRRCSPVCALVKNTPLFRRVVETVGLTPSVRFQVGTAFYYDTFSLITSVMSTHGQRCIVSSKIVNHFTQASYLSEYRAPKDRDCLLLLEELRAGRGMGHENFYVSEWVRTRRAALDNKE